MSEQEITRRHRRIVFGAAGPTANRWSCVDLEAPGVVEAAHALRYGGQPNYDLASAMDDYRYLVLGCPTTKLAQQKLAQMRRAYRSGTLCLP